MQLVMLDLFSDFAKGITFTQPAASATKAISVFSDPTLIIAAIILIAVTIFILFFLKKVIINSILGGIILLISYFGFGVQLPLLPSLAVSIIFGPAGVGVMIILKFLGLF